MNKPFQRLGAKSNAHVGRDFELTAQVFFSDQGLNLRVNLPVKIGVGDITKKHSFDLGCEEKKVLVECKSHKWTMPNDNVPSAKLTVWNEAMYYFLLAPHGYRKIMFVLRDYSDKRDETLASYYLRAYSHLVPEDVEFWEYDDLTKMAIQLSLK